MILVFSRRPLEVRILIIGKLVNSVIEISTFVTVSNHEHHPTVISFAQADALFVGKLLLEDLRILLYELDDFIGISSNIAVGWETSERYSLLN